ncbi:MAG TPA: hypothetical protein PKZ27_02905 [Rhodocyclaceae bacterium]|nr:hypothetical protein [Burkholderiaceae bacterium]HRP74515.1 hypothetical protein [Rhodocyclaceae bacterium]
MSTILDHFNRLTPAEAERLAMLAEECGEVVQIVGKILRHGYGSCHPDNPHLPNRRMLEKEAGDLYAVLELMLSEGDIHSCAISDHTMAKQNAFEKWTHHQQGAL